MWTWRSETGSSSCPGHCSHRLLPWSRCLVAGLTHSLWVDPLLSSMFTEEVHPRESCTTWCSRCEFRDPPDVGCTSHSSNGGHVACSHNSLQPEGHVDESTVPHRFVRACHVWCVPGEGLDQRSTAPQRPGALLNSPGFLDGPKGSRGEEQRGERHNLVVLGRSQKRRRFHVGRPWWAPVRSPLIHHDPFSERICEEHNPF